MKQGTASSIERRRQAVAVATLPLSGEILPLNISDLSAFWFKSITLQNVASARVIARPRFCSSTHAPNCTCTSSRHH